jgi:hypothetical protein
MGRNRLLAVLWSRIALEVMISRLDRRMVDIFSKGLLREVLLM